MGGVTVTPETFTMVDYDHGEISAVLADLVARLGLDDRDVILEIDQTTPMGRTSVEDLDPLTIHAESGALEDAKRPRQFDPAGMADSIGRNLIQARDQLDESFGSPSPHNDLPMAYAAAWDVYAVGRLTRLGFPGQRQRRLYQFRNRHGFTDNADAAFERLWTAERLSWDDIVAVSDGAQSQPESLRV